MVTRALKVFDCQIVEAANGAEGFDAALREKPDLIFLDVTMPVMDGMQMLAKLRGDANLKAVPVIMLTAESSQDNIAQADKLGISGYVPKPFKEAQLVEKVKAAIQIELRPAA